MEFVVVHDAVEVCLWTDKELPPHVVADSGAQMQKKVVAVELGDAASGVAATGITVIEKHGRAAGAGAKQSRGLLGHMRRIHGIEVVEERTIFLEAVVEPFLVQGGNLGAVAEFVAENAVDSDAGINAALFRRRQIGFRGRSVPGGEQFAGANGKVKLLSMRETG